MFNIIKQIFNRHLLMTNIHACAKFHQDQITFRGSRVVTCSGQTDMQHDWWQYPLAKMFSELYKLMILGIAFRIQSIGSVSSEHVPFNMHANAMTTLISSKKVWKVFKTRRCFEVVSLVFIQSWIRQTKQVLRAPRQVTRGTADVSITVLFYWIYHCEAELGPHTSTVNGCMAVSHTALHVTLIIKTKPPPSPQTTIKLASMYLELNCINMDELPCHSLHMWRM